MIFFSAKILKIGINPHVFLPVPVYCLPTPPMKILLNVLKWIFIILFFPVSLLFIAYFNQRRSRIEYFKDEY